MLAFAGLASSADTTNAPARLTPGPNDGRIAFVTASLLDNYHYTLQPLDTEMSKKFYDGYLETLDPRRENFLQSDIDEFSHYRTNLDELTIGGHSTSDLTPAFEIFQRFKERLQQHDDYAEELLKEDHFKFNGNDKLVIDRRHAPYPKDLAAAKQLWREQLRYQYLQEKLSRELSATNHDAVVALPKNSAADIAKTLERHYRWNYQTFANWDHSDVLQAYLEALAHAYDPHSDYFSAPHAEDFSINMSLALVGIGAQLQEDDGYCTISKLIPGGPAAKSKQIHEQDRIIAVAQGNNSPVDVVDMDLSKVVQLIRGTKGTVVRLTISPAEDHALRRVVTLTRDEIKLEDEEAKAKLIEMPNGHGSTNRIGVIDLPSFYATIALPGNDHTTAKSTTADVTKLIEKLKKENVDGIILDLRYNPGGSLEEAVNFTGLFIKDGPVVLARAPDGHVSVDADTDPSELYSGPLIVLVNRFSASAAEIAAAALQDYGRAVIVGDTSTHGKGTVQNLTPLRPFWPSRSSLTNDPGTLKITIRKFYRVSGASTQLKGVVPDIILPDIFNYSDQIGETSLDNPLPWDTIPTAKYDKLNLVAPYIADLRQNSDARIATNQDFKYIGQDIDQFKKLQADKTITLNEHEQIEERQANAARQKTRDAELQARPPSGIKTYEITVENAGNPGLPAPMPLTETNYASTGTSPEITYGTDSNSEVFFKTNAMAKTSPANEPTNTNGNYASNFSSTNQMGRPIVKKISPLDPTLRETVNIMEDYISDLSGAHAPLVAK